MVSVNLEAKKTVDVMIEKQDELNIAVSQLSNGATIIEMLMEVSKQVNFTLKFVLGVLLMLEFLFLVIYLKNSLFLQ